MKQYRIKGINDDESTCHICGKEQLKRVVWLEDIENGQILAAGTTCAAHLQKISVKEQKQKEKGFEADQKAAIHAEIFPFEQAHSAVVRSAPEAFGPHAVPMRVRLDFISQHPATVAYAAKKNELATRFGVALWQVR